MKKCVDCQQVKSMLEFYKHSSYCKDCCKKRARKWSLNNPRKVKLSQQKYGASDRAKEMGKIRYQDNIEVYRERVNKWCKNNRKHLSTKENKGVAELSDKYIRKLLTRRGGIKNPTPEQIIAKRKDVQDYRDKYTATDEPYFCKECGNTVPHKKGQRIKPFCSTDCKTKYWQR